MPVSEYEQLISYPLPAYNFRVTVGDQTVSFARVSGLRRFHQTATYRHGLSWTEGETMYKFYVPIWDDLQLERGSFPGASGSTWLYAWLEDSEPRSIQIDMCDAQGNAVIRWSIAKALVVRMTGPNLDANANDVGVESLELKVTGVTLAEEGRELTPPADVKREGT